MPELSLDAADARPLPRHHRRGDPEARGAHRRPARSRAARRRRRHAGVRGRAGRGALRPRRSIGTARPSATGASRSTSRRSQPDLDGPRRRAAARAGAAEPRRQRAPAHARGRHVELAACGRIGRCAVHIRSQTRAPASRRSTCRTSSIGSTRSIRRARQRQPRPAAASGLSIVQAIVERHGGRDRRVERREGGRRLRDRAPGTGAAECGVIQNGDDPSCQRSRHLTDVRRSWDPDP